MILVCFFCFFFAIFITIIILKGGNAQLKLFFFRLWIPSLSKTEVVGFVIFVHSAYNRNWENCNS